MARILLIEDEEKTAHFIKKGLEENDYIVDAVTDGKSGHHLAFRNDYDLIISDIILPGLDGRELCRELRAGNIETPVLMLSALGATDDIVIGFDHGADDYLVKPFEFRELLARIKALIKRHQKLPGIDNIVKLADLVMDLNLKSVSRGDRHIDLTAKEFALLQYLLQHQGKVISRAELARNIWKIDFDTGTNMVEVYVNYLRKKIDKGFEKKLIHNQFGMGYILQEEK